LIDLVPVVDDGFLCVGESHVVLADLAIEISLDFVFVPCAAVFERRVIAFGPQIFGISWISSDFEGNEMVLFVVTFDVVGKAIMREAQDFDAVRILARGRRGCAVKPGLQMVVWMFA
jgi:hypothetical protein